MAFLRHKIRPFCWVLGVVPWISMLPAQDPGYLSVDFLGIEELSEEETAALEEMLDNPLNLNTSTAAELWFLEDSLVTILMEAREEGPFRSWSQVAQRTRLEPDILAGLRQLTYLPAEDVSFRLSSRIVTDGSDERIRSRLVVSQELWRAQVVTQRDPREYQLTDMLDPSISYQGERSQLLIGSHRFTWGGGLIFGEEFPPLRGESLLRTPDPTGRLRPGYSNSNTGVLRGASLQQSGAWVRLLGGFSRQQVDITSEGDGAYRVVPYRTHLHPTDGATESLAYVAGTIHRAGWYGGALNTRYQLRPADTSRALERSAYSVIGGYTRSHSYGEWHVCHEQAWSEGAAGTPAAGEENGKSLHSTITQFTFTGRAVGTQGRLGFTVHHRMYPAGWTAWRGRLPADRASTGNESAWLLGWTWRLSDWSLNGYLDTYAALVSEDLQGWAPRGRESSLSWRYSPDPWEALLVVRQRQETATEITAGDERPNVGHLASSTSRYLKGHLTWTLTSAIRIRITAASMASIFDHAKGSGAALGGNLRLRIPEGCALVLGCHGFDTDTWDQRIYVYEEGLPGELQMRVLSGKGYRVHGRLTLPMGHGQLTLRMSRQRHREVVGGPVREDRQAGLQMDVAL